MPKKRRDSNATSLVCATCHTEKSLEEFRRKKSPCRVCENAQQRERTKHIREQHNSSDLDHVDTQRPMTCNRCLETKPLEEFRKDHSRRTGYTQPCKKCSSHQSSLYAKAMRGKRQRGEILPIDTSIPWICTHCGKTKPVRDFVTATSSLSGYAQPCILCMRKIAKDYYRKNIEQIKNNTHHKYQQKVWRNNNRHRVTVSIAAWRDKHPEYEHKRAKTKREWQKSHPDQVRNAVLSRRARKRNAFVEKVDYAILYARDCGICQLRYPRCKERITKKQGSVDHILPLALGGEHSYRNCQLACLPCNMKKNKHGKGDQMRLF